MNESTQPPTECKNEINWTYWATHFIWLAIVAAVFLFYKAENEAALEQAREVRMWARIVLSNSEELSDAADRFSTEDWRNVVPKVRRAANDLYGSAEQLSIEAEQLENELAPDPPEPGSRNPWQ